MSHHFTVSLYLQLTFLLIFDTTHLKSKKMLKRLLLLIDILILKRVEIYSGSKESCEVEKKNGSPEKYMTQVKNLSLKLNLSSIIYYESKILTYIPRLVSFNLDSWKLIIGLWYNPNSKCLSILHFFHLTTFWIELRNIHLILKQLHKINGSKG